MSGTATNRGSGTGSGRRSPSALAIVGIIVAVFAVFAAGFGAARFFGSSSGSSGGPSPLPCVTVQVTPGAGLPKPSAVTLNVYNATKKAGLARKTAAAMAAYGFKIGKIANDPLGKTIAATAEIRHGASGTSAAKLVGFYVPGSIQADDQRGNATVDLVIGEAFTALATPAAVAKALAGPSPSPSGAGCASGSPKTSVASSSAAPASPAT